MSVLKTISAEDIIKLFKKKLDMACKRQSIYHHMVVNSFPNPIAPRTRPARWNEDQVLKWFDKQIRANERR